MNAFVEFLQILFDPRGRVRRSGWWQALLVLFGLWLIAAFAIVGIGFSGGARVHRIDMGAWALILLVPTAVRRLHDRDKSGWWLIAFFAVPAALEGLGDKQAAWQPFLSIIGLVLTLWGFVEIACRRGTIGANRYGADPLARPACHPEFETSN